MISAPTFTIEIDDVDVVQHELNAQNVIVDLSLDSFGNFSIVFTGDAGTSERLFGLQ